jgi:uncharacterized protein
MNPVLELRRKAKLTQSELAQRSGVAQPNIAGYESGRRRPSAAMIERLRACAQPLPRQRVAAHRAEILAIAAKFRMRDVRVFGSIARLEDHADSDVDLLVTAPADAGLLTLSKFQLTIQDLLGIPVDVVTTGGLRVDHPILSNALPL